MEVMMLLKVRNMRKDSSLAHAQHLTFVFETQPMTLNASPFFDRQQSGIKVSVYNSRTVLRVILCQEFPADNAIISITSQSTPGNIIGELAYVRRYSYYRKLMYFMLSLIRQVKCRHLTGW